MDYVYEDIDDYNPNRKKKKLVTFEDMIADIMVNKKFQVIIKDLVIRGRKHFKYFACIYHSVLFFCSKRCQRKYNTLCDYEN